MPPTFAARHCLQGCGDVPRVLPVDCTAPLRRLAQAQAQWLPMQLMKVRTPCTRAPYAMRVSHMHLRTRAHRPAQMCVCCTQRGSVGLWGSRRDSPRGSRSRAAIDAPRHPVLDANLLAAVAIAVDAALLAAVAAALLAAVATSFDPPVFLPVHAAHGSAAAPARASRPSLVPRVASARPHSSTVRTTRRNNGLIAGGQGVRRNAFSVEYKKRCPAC